MTTDEQARVLRMIAEGKLTVDQGGALLDALRPEPFTSSLPPPMQDVPSGPRQHAPIMAAAARSLVIQISERGESRVNLRIPLGLARAATRFIPRQAQDYLERYEIDLANLVSGVGTEAYGPLIEIKDNDDTVRIAVE